MQLALDLTTHPHWIVSDQDLTVRLPQILQSL